MDAICAVVHEKPAQLHEKNENARLLCGYEIDTTLERGINNLKHRLLSGVLQKRSV